MHDVSPLHDASPDAPGAAAVGTPKRQAAIIFIFITVMIDTIAMAITAPVLPQLIERLAGGGVQQAAWLNGVFMAVFSAMQFLCSPILGGLSDRYGRRPILLLSIVGLGVSYAAMGLAGSVWELLVIRVLTGATSANISTAFAYVADVTPADRRAGAFGLMQAAMSLGFALGPAVGGFLGKVDPRAPFFAAAACSLINATYGYFVVPESLSQDRRAPFRWRGGGSLGAIAVFKGRPDLLRLAIINMLAQFATLVFPTVFVLYAAHRYGWGIIAISACMTVFGVCSALVQAGLSGRIVRAFGERRVMVFGLFCGVVGLTTFGLAAAPVIFVCAIPIMTLSGLTQPSVQSMMTQQVLPTEQGKLQGANVSLQSLAGVISPLMFGAVFSLAMGDFQSLDQPGAPFLLAALIVVAATVMAWQFMRRETLRPLPA